MPVIKIYHHESLGAAVRSCADKIVAGLQKMMREKLKADPNKCQVIITSCATVAPLPLYVDMQFRANSYRSRAVIASAMQDIADTLQSELHAGVRIRAFDIEQTTLHALDSEIRERP